MEEVSKSKTAMDIFTKHSHHRNMTVLFLVQKLYGWTHNTRVISQNAHLMICVQRSDIGASDVPRKPFMFLSEAFIDATKRPHSHLVVNSYQRTDDRMRVMGNLFEQANPAVYIPK